MAIRDFTKLNAYRAPRGRSPCGIGIGLAPARERRGQPAGEAGHPDDEDQALAAIT